MQEIVATINGYVWSEALIFLCLGTGLFFSVMTRFVQVRLFREMIHLLCSFPAKNPTVAYPLFRRLPSPYPAE